VSDPLARLRLDYRSAFVGYLSRRGETQLSSGYEIGRAAILSGVGLLDLVQVHNAVTADLLRSAPEGTQRLELAEAAGGFLVEVLAAFEMAQRGYVEGLRTRRAGEP